MNKFKVSTHGSAYKWYILKERILLFFWKTHYKYYDTREEVLKDIAFLENLKGRKEE